MSNKETREATYEITTVYLADGTHVGYSVTEKVGGLTAAEVVTELRGRSKPQQSN